VFCAEGPLCGLKGGMRMTERIAEWIRGWIGGAIEVETERTQLRPGMMGVYRCGRKTRLEHPDGGFEEVYRFALEVCLSGLTGAERAYGAALLEAIEAQIAKKDVEGDLPAIDGMDCWRAEIVSGFCMKTGGAAERVYRAEMDIYCEVM